MNDDLLTAFVRKAVEPAKPQPTLDAVVDDDDALNYALTTITVTAVAIIQEWLETPDDDLDEGETLADRLQGSLLGLADPDQDDEELDDDEADVFDMARESAWDYMVSKGVSDDDAGLLLNDWDNDAAIRIRDLLASNIPDGDGAIEDIDSFAFDSAAGTFDAVYKKKSAIRDGKKVRINKRISGKVRLSTKQKLSLRKAQRKAHTATATMRRMRSQKKAALINN